MLFQLEMSHDSPFKCNIWAKYLRMEHQVGCKNPMTFIREILMER